MFAKIPALEKEINHLLAIKLWTYVEKFCRKSCFQSVPLQKWYWARPKVSLVNVMLPLFCIVQHYALLCPLDFEAGFCFLCSGHCSWTKTKCPDCFSSSYWVLTVSSLLFSVLRSPETGTGGEDLSPAKTSKHRWVTFESQQIKWLVGQLWDADVSRKDV